MSESSALLAVATSAATSAVLNNTHNNNNTNANNNNGDKDSSKAEEYTGICGCCKWFMSGNYCSKKKLVFIGWIFIAVLSPIFYAIYLNSTDSIINYGFILCCSLAITMSLYATFNFRDVISLRNAVNLLVESTKDLAVQRDRIRNEVGKLQLAHNKLEGIEEKLSTSNGALRKNFKKLETWHKTIKEETKSNAENASMINKDFRSAIQQYQKLLIQNEKAILDKAYRHVEGQDGKKGLNKEEFNDLLYSLPARYKLKFEELGATFEDFAGDDNNIDHNEFSEFMDQMAEQQANCGVEIPEYGISSKKKRKRNNDDGKDDEKGN